MTKSESATYTADVLTTVTETGETLACGIRPAGACGNATLVNATGSSITLDGNYTQANCLVSYSGEAGNANGFNNSNWNASYSCTYAGEAYTSANATIIGIGTFADFWEIIVLAVIISLIIGLLLVMFGGRRTR